MGFLGKLVGATIKTALTPVGVVKDIANVATGQKADATKTLIDSAVEDLKDATDDLADGEL